MARTPVTKTKAQLYQEGQRRSVELNSPAWARSVINGQATDRTKLVEHAVQLGLGERTELTTRSLADLNKIVGDALLQSNK